MSCQYNCILSALVASRWVGTTNLPLRMRGKLKISFSFKSNQFISETADSKIEIRDNDNDNVQPLTEVRKKLLPALTSDLTSNTVIILTQWLITQKQHQA